jgi:hypothetical protein
LKVAVTGGLVGAVITTTGGTPRVTVIVADVVPTAFVQVTLIVLAPMTRGTRTVVLLAGALFTVHTIPEGTEVAPLTVNDTFTFAAVVNELFAGDVIATPGGVRRLTTMLEEALPAPFAQVTVMVFAPIARATELVCVFVVPMPFRAQVVPTGRVVPPLTMNETFVVLAAVEELLAGDVIETTGGTQLAAAVPNQLFERVAVAPLHPARVLLATGVPHVVVGLLISFDVKLIDAVVHGTCGIVDAYARTRSAEPSPSTSTAAAEPLSGALTPLAPRRM